MNKVARVLISSLLVAGMAGCGSSSAAAASTAAAGTTAADTAAAATSAAAAAADEGTSLNIQVWNEEFKSRVENHYPGYEKVDETHGKIGDVDVVWTITSNQDNAYQNHLDEILPDNTNSSDPVDLFCVEADYALKYVNSDVTMNLADLGITDSDLSDQYEYTKDIVKDSDGNLKGASWQACSAGLIYNRDIAKEVLGTEDPEEVQEYVKDWDTYNATAKTLKDAGYYITSSAMDTYRVYSNNVTKKWVDDSNNIQIDDNIKKWVDDSKALVDAGETNTYSLWSDDWSKGFYPAGKVFAYFGPAWLINFSMASSTDGSVANSGRWGLAEGPQGFYWGGTWICAATGTDNPTLVKDIILTMTTDKDVLREIADDDADCVNSKSVLADLAAADIEQRKPGTNSDDDGGSITWILGGQNPYAQLAAGAEKVDMSNISDYDQGCNEEFQNAMQNYFNGTYATYDDALDAFYKAIHEKYPDVNVPEA